MYTYIKYRLYRHNCRKQNEGVVKDLSELGRDLSKVMIIDNLDENYVNQHNNGLLSLTWVDDIFDMQMNDFLEILKFLNENKVENIPNFIAKLNFEIEKQRKSKPEGSKPRNLYSGLALKSFL
jgi:TFIIF-interacting CTD phosphatase-like protein